MLRAERNLANLTLNHLLDLHIPGPQKSCLTRRMTVRPNLQKSLHREGTEETTHFVFLQTING